MDTANTFNMTMAAWNEIDAPLPEGFDPTPLTGELYQLAWALYEGKIFKKGTTRELMYKVQKSKMVWMKHLGCRLYCLHINNTFRKEQIANVSDHLEKIKVRGPYHPKCHQLPKGYNKTQQTTLECDSEPRLVQVLCKVGVLDKATVGDLHGKLKRGGSIFGSNRPAIFHFVALGCVK